jgi:hypothetical protein
MQNHCKSDGKHTLTMKYLSLDSSVKNCNFELQTKEILEGIQTVSLDISWNKKWTTMIGEELKIVLKTAKFGFRCIVIEPCKESSNYSENQRNRQVHFL